MVCVPCIFIPLFLWVYHKFLQPYVAPFLNPIWEKITGKKIIAEKPDENGCVGGVCPMKPPKKKEEEKELILTKDSDDENPAMQTRSRRARKAD